MARAVAYPTTDELVSLLQRSHLPTILVEGDDDMIVYRGLETEFSSQSLSILPVGSRSTLLTTFDRRGELPGNVAMGFIADSDSWVITGVPAAFVEPRLILTYGYSVENDVFIDAELFQLLDATQRARFLAELPIFLRWYALEFSRHVAGMPADLKLHPNMILDNAAIREQRMQLRPAESYPQELFEMISNDFPRLLRGKSLLGLLQRQLAKDYTNRGLLGLSAIKRGNILGRLSASVAILLGLAAQEDARN